MEVNFPLARSEAPPGVLTAQLFTLRPQQFISYSSGFLPGALSPLPGLVAAPASVWRAGTPCIHLSLLS